MGTSSSAKMVSIPGVRRGTGATRRRRRFLQFLAAADADQGDGDRGVAEHPGDGELGDRLAVAGGDRPEPFDHPQLPKELLALEQGQAEGLRDVRAV